MQFPVWIVISLIRAHYDENQSFDECVRDVAKYLEYKVATPYAKYLLEKIDEATDTARSEVS